MERVLMISGDGHASLPGEEFRPYVDAAHRGRFDEWLASLPQFGWPRSREEAMARAGEASFRALLHRDIVEPMERVLVDEGAAAAEWDPEQRVAFLESRGVVAEVVYPNAVPLDGSPLRMLTSPYSVDEQWAGLQAYNRWLADFCSVCPARFSPQVLVSFTDLDRAVQELAWGRDHGFSGVMIPGIRDENDPWWDAGYARFWAACADLGMVVDVHGGIGAPNYGSLEGASPHTSMRVMFGEATWFSHRPLHFLMWTGVFARHPDLRVAFTEQHADWIAPTLARMDHSWRSGMLDASGIRELVPRPPSDYWREQCFVGASLLSRAEACAAHEIGVDKMMFGIDFPHPEGAWVDTTGYIRATLGAAGVGADDARRILGGNAADLYGFDRPTLEARAAEVGPDLGELLTPLSPEDEQAFLHTDVFRPAAYA